MLRRVFRIFRERGGLLRTLDLWEWYEGLSADQQKAVKMYYTLKVVKDLRFPYRANHFDSGEVESTPYTRRTFLATIAQTALLEGDYEFAEWLYNQALGMEGTPLEAHLILNDLIVLSQKLGDPERIRKYCEEDLRLLPECRDELRKRSGGGLPRIVSVEIYVYLLEREGKRDEALRFLERMKEEGVVPPHYEDIRTRLLSL